MDWFERLTGFRERDYAFARSQLRIDDEGRLVSRANGASYGVGKLSLPSLRELREQFCTIGGSAAGRPEVTLLRGDARSLHRRPECEGALFQVASQFNLLEMTGPDLTPEDGVTRYEHDRTQGPACAIAAGAATIYRNYFAPVGGEFGQTASRQIDVFADVGADLGAAIGKPVRSLWEMRNGYALCSRSGLEAIAAYLATLSAEGRDALGAKLRIGLHSDVEVTDAAAVPRPVVSQAFCSALPIAYGGPIPIGVWEPFARLVLEASYEATVLAGALNAARGASPTVLLTLVGGGVFGNREAWILDAIRRALRRVARVGLDVRIVSYSEPSSGLEDLVAAFNPPAA